jgi:hypothetical protein
MSETTSDRPALRAPFALIAVVFVALTLLAVVVGQRLWERYSPELPKSLFHVPSDVSYAARIDLPNPALERAIEPVLRALDAPRRPGLDPRHERLVKKGRPLAGSVSEVALARGPGADDWVITASGDLPATGLLEAISEVLQEEGWSWQLDLGRGRLVAPEGIALGQAPDGTLILASDPVRLARAQKRDTGEPPRNVAHGVFPDRAEVERTSGELAALLAARFERGLASPGAPGAAR